MADFIKHAADGATLKLIDGTPTTPLELALALEGGDLSITGLKPGLKDTKVYAVRGKLRAVRKGVPQQPAMSLSVQVDRLTKATGGRILDWLAKRGPFEDRVTTLVIGDEDTCHVEYVLLGTESGGVDETILLKNVNISADFTEGEPTAFRLTGTIYGDILLEDEVLFAAPVMALPS